MTDNIIKIDPIDSSRDSENFVYPKNTLKPVKDEMFFDIDYDRFRDLLSKYPKEAFELAAACGNIDMKTGKLIDDYTQDNAQDWMEYNVLETINMVRNQGHPGFMFDYLMTILVPLLKLNNVTPLTGEDWEWFELPDVLAAEDRKYQNKRFTEIFKESKDGPAYWIKGKVYSDDGGETWILKNDGSSRALVQFPCVTQDLKPEHIYESPKEEANE